LFKALEQADAPRELIVGIRPMDITLNPEPDKAIAQARTDVFEPFGSQGLLSVKVQDIYLELLLDAELNFEPDTVVGLDFRDDKLNFFDPASENNLLCSEE